MDDILFPGCGLDCRILGVIQAEQSEQGRTYRNDRILAVSVKDVDGSKSLSDLDKRFVEDVERFFATYHQAEGNRFKVLRTGSAEEAYELIKRNTLVMNR